MVVGPSRHTHMCNAVTLVCGSLRLPHITAYCIVPGKLPWSLTAQTEGVRLYRGGALMVQLSPTLDANRYFISVSLKPA